MINPYVLCDQEPKIEGSKRAQIKNCQPENEAAAKPKRNTKVLNVSDFLRKKVLKKSKNKKGESIHRGNSLTR